ncbi:MAG TPA: hypothetical protein VH989_03770 [Actinomycetota bacterium]|jgi:hypothetical protein
MNVAYRLIEYGCRVRTSSEDLARVARALLEPFEVSDGRGPEYLLERVDDAGKPFRLAIDGEEVTRVSTALELIDELLWKLNRAAIPTSPGIAVHAGAVSLDGRGVVLPAPMDSGKTTLTAGLVGAGLSYLSDEAAVFAPDSGELLAYPKPMWLSPGSVAAFDGLRDRVLPEYREPGRMRTYVRADDLGDGRVGRACPVVLVVTPRFLAASALRLEPMTRAATLLCLAENAFNLQELGGAGLEQLRRATAGADGYRLTYGDLDEAVATILALLRTETSNA